MAARNKREKSLLWRDTQATSYTRLYMNIVQYVTNPSDTTNILTGSVRIIPNRVLLEQPLPMESWYRKQTNKQAQKTAKLE